MNNREKFEEWYSDNGTLQKAIEKYPNGEYSYMGAAHAWSVWKICAESKQAELDKANAEVEHYLSAYRLAHKQAMDNGQARDKANARIAQIEEWRDNAASVMAQFIHLSSNPCQESWSIVARDATRLLNDSTGRKV